MPLRFGNQQSFAGGLVFGDQSSNAAPVVLTSDGGDLLVGGGVVNLPGGFLTAERGPLSFTGTAGFQYAFGVTAGLLSLTGSATLPGQFSSQRGLLTLLGSNMVPQRGLGAVGGTMLLGGGSALFPGSLVTTADRGVLTFIAQSGVLDQVLISNPGQLTITGSISLFRETQSASQGAMALVGGSATFTSTAQTFLNAQRGTLLLGPGTATFTPTLLAAPGTVTFSGAATFDSYLASVPGAVTLVGTDVVFDTDTVTAAQHGTLTLTGLAALIQSQLLQKGTLSLGGGVATLTATQINDILAEPGTLLLIGDDVAFLVTGLPWEGDDATWGGSIALFGETLPVFTIDREFFQAGNANSFGNEAIQVILERVGLTVVGVDREGKPRSDPEVLKLMREVWPVVRGIPGTIINIYAGGQEQIEGGIYWQGPFPFVIGQDVSVQPLAEGVYLAIRFESNGQPPWHLVSYDVDVVPLGVVPR